jgi:hypothetical protein
VTIFAAGKTDHHAVAVFNHREVADRFAHAAQQSGLDLVVRAHNSFRSACHKTARRYNFVTKLDTMA